MSVRPITDTLRLLHGGTFLDTCSSTLAEVVKGVDETGKSGKLTITLDVKKAGAAVSVLAKVTDKTPEEAPDADLFWPTVEGNLSLQNPNQRSLALEVVDRDTGEITRVDTPVGELKTAL